MIALKDSLGTEFVDTVLVQSFPRTGLLSKAKNFEYRPEQQEMAVAVARALEEERHLVVEAGTGVGKSLAYLVPAILFALERKKKAIISTHTINLQEQLLHKDIPILKKILPVEFEAALDERPAELSLSAPAGARDAAGEGELFTTSGASRIWRESRNGRGRRRDGSLSDLPVEPDPKVWTQVCSEAHICTTKTCGQDPSCFSSRRASDCSRPTSSSSITRCFSCSSAARKNRRNGRAVIFSLTTSSFSTKRTRSNRSPRARSGSGFRNTGCARPSSGSTTPGPERVFSPSRAMRPA